VSAKNHEVHSFTCGIRHPSAPAPFPTPNRPICLVRLLIYTTRPFVSCSICSSHKSNALCTPGDHGDRVDFVRTPRHPSRTSSGSANFSLNIANHFTKRPQKPTPLLLPRAASAWVRKLESNVSIVPLSISFGCRSASSKRLLGAAEDTTHFVPVRVLWALVCRSRIRSEVHCRRVTHIARRFFGPEPNAIWIRRGSMLPFYAILVAQCARPRCSALFHYTLSGSTPRHHGQPSACSVSRIPAGE